MTKSGQRLAVSELAKLHVERLAAIEAASEPVYAIPSEYPAGYHVKPHSHSRAQFVYARAGVVMVSSVQGRWMVPPQHALWIPAGLVHMVDMLGDVTMLSAYVAPNALADPPTAIRVVALTDLARALIIEAVASPSGATSGRHNLVMALLLEEVLRLPDRPLGLPFPSDVRLAALCRGFLENPSARLVIDDWAERLAMSRRAFTRFFRKETESVSRRGASRRPYSQPCPASRPGRPSRPSPSTSATTASLPSPRCSDGRWALLREHISKRRPNNIEHRRNGSRCRKAPAASVGEARYDVDVHGISVAFKNSKNIRLTFE